MESKSEGKYDDDDVGAKGGGGGGCKGDGGGDAKGSSGGRGGALIREVFDYYCESKELEAAVREFVFANCRTFGEAGGEYELEHTDIYNDFKRLLETKLEGHIESRGASVAEFYDAVADNAGSSYYTGHSFAAVLNGATSFESFADLMCDARNGEFTWVSE